LNVIEQVINDFIDPHEIAFQPGAQHFKRILPHAQAIFV
jgi:hypothetical protein